MLGPVAFLARSGSSGSLITVATYKRIGLYCGHLNSQPVADLSVHAGATFCGRSVTASYDITATCWAEGPDETKSTPVWNEVRRAVF